MKTSTPVITNNVALVAGAVLWLAIFWVVWTVTP